MTGRSYQVKDLKPTDLPTPPQSAIQIMRECAKNEVNHADLAKLASSDPALSAELLRIVNSPYFGLTRAITSIPRAVTVIGHRALRNVALCVSVRDALKQEEMPGIDINTFWEDAIRRAVTARSLGSHLNLDIDDCFTAGLLQDFGLLVMFYLYPEHSPEWPNLRMLDPDERLEQEKVIFGTTHNDVGLALAEAWTLPSDLASGMGYHHNLDHQHTTPQQAQECKILFCADWVSSLYTANDKNKVINHCFKILAEHLNLEQTSAEELFIAIPQQVSEASQALGLGIQDQQDFDQILRSANARLAEANMSYQELTWQLEQALRERDKIQAELDRELNLAREIQTNLLPQNVPEDAPTQGVNLSAKELSGDFYDFFTLENGQIYFILGDVSGKGLNAALLMAKAGSLFRGLGKRITDPSKLIYEINNELCETSIRGMFVTTVIGLFDPITRNVTLVNAGHVPVLITGPEGKFAKFESQTIPVGICEDEDFPSVTFNLGNRRLYLYSDGVTEGQLSNGDELGISGLITQIRNIVDLPVLEQLDTLTALFTSTNTKLRDDITIVIIG